MTNDVKISYDGLWKLLIEKKLKKQELRVQAGLTHSVITKLNKEETVHLDVLLKICKLLDCDIKDIVEIRKNIKED
ncbi:MAG: helix-turn-helix transcriptional regulator [Clostridia bacterium]|nr:helix-turn-helix transcriptional regulator [Clostridia bacterium]